MKIPPTEPPFKMISDSIAEKFWVHKHSCVLLNHSSDLGGCWKVSFFLHFELTGIKYVQSQYLSGRLGQWRAGFLGIRVSTCLSWYFGIEFFSSRDGLYVSLIKRDSANSRVMSRLK